MDPMVILIMPRVNCTLETLTTGTNRIFIQPKSGENGIVAYEDELNRTLL